MCGKFVFFNVGLTVLTHLLQIRKVQGCLPFFEIGRNIITMTNVNEALKLAFVFCSPAQLTLLVWELFDAPVVSAPSCESGAISRTEGLIRSIRCSAQMEEGWRHQLTRFCLLHVNNKTNTWVLFVDILVCCQNLPTHPLNTFFFLVFLSVW